MEPTEDFVEISGENVQVVYCEVFHGPEKQAVKVCMLKNMFSYRNTERISYRVRVSLE